MEKFAKLDSNTKLLLTNRDLDDIWNLRRSPELPVKAFVNPLLEKTADGRIPCGGTVIFDKDENLFKCWYTSYDEALHYAWKPGHSQMAYATSADGINWDFPNLGLYSDGWGRLENNLVFPLLGSVYKDEFDPDETRRYKMLYSPDSGGLCAAFSADGIHWKKYSETDEVLIPGANDTTNGFFFDPAAGKYVRYGRPNILAAKDISERDLGIEPNWSFEEELGSWSEAAKPPKGVIFPDYDDFLDFPEAEDFMHRYLRQAPYTHTKTLRAYKYGNLGCNRRIIRAESEDFIHWSRPELVIAPDELDPAKLYGMSAMRYENTYIGLLQLFDTLGARRIPLSSLESDTIDVQLVFSDDGKNWERLANRPVFLPRGHVGTYDGGMIFGGTPPFIEYGDELRIYYSGAAACHSLPAVTGRTMNVARLPKGRLVARTAGDELGALITKPMVLAGNALELNIDARQGLARAELTDAEGRPIPGFTAADSDIIRENSLAHRVSWHGSTDIKSLSGQAVRLRIYLHRSKLYSFRAV